MMINNLALRWVFLINTCLARIKKFIKFTLDAKKPAHGWFLGRNVRRSLSEAGVIHLPFTDNESLDVELLLFFSVYLPLFICLVITDND